MPLDPSLITDTLARWQTPQFTMPDQLAQYAKLQALRNGVMQQQTAALDLQQKQQEIAGQQALRTAIQQSITPGQNGAPGSVDHNAVVQSLGQSGHGDLIDPYMQGVATRAKTQADLAKVQNENQQSTIDTATRIFSAAGDQTGWDKGLAFLHGHGVDPQQIGIPPAYSPDTQAKVVQFGMSVKDQLDTLAKQADAAAKTKEANVAGDKEQREKDQDFRNAYGGAQNANDAAAIMAQARTSGVSPSVISSAPAAWTPDAAKAFAEQNLTAKDRSEIAQRKQDADALAANRAAELAQGAQRIGLESGRLGVERQNAGINAQKYAMEYGGDAVKGWAKQVADNPDTANQVPPALRTPVMQQFTSDTGLPFPKPLAGTAVDQERASRNALDAVKQIQEAVKDPEIQSRLGTILGNLGKVEQTFGTAVGLSPAGEAKAQQVRTNMRYLLLTEAKATMGRVSQGLVQQLEQSSPDVKMDTGTLSGALAGVSDAANRNLDQTYKQRFGEAATRPAASGAATGGTAKAPPLPLKLSSSDVGKVFTNKAGQRIRVTAVNPANPAQMQSTVVP